MVTKMLIDEMYVAMRLLHDRLGHMKGKWLIGGSCNLLLQGIQLTTKPRDLDVYADQDQIVMIDQQLRDYATDEPQFSETVMYRSMLSHYVIDGIEIELVGHFEVESEGSQYEVVLQGQMAKFAAEHRSDDCTFYLMPLAHELVFNLLRQRIDRLAPLAIVMKEQLEQHLPALQAIVSANKLSSIHIEQLNEWLDCDLPC